MLRGGNTFITTDLNCHDSLLLNLAEKSESRKVNSSITKNPVTKKKIAEYNFKRKVEYTRSEPNVLLLDTAQFAFDSYAFNGEEEILRIDNLFRRKLRLPSKEDKVAQPWVLEKEKIKHFLALKFTIKSEITLENPLLAVEDAENFSHL